MTDDTNDMSRLDCGSATAERTDTFLDDRNGMENEVFDVVTSSRPVVLNSLNGSKPLTGLHQDLDCGSVTPESDDGYYGDL